jgi:hypothetical protein
MGSRLKRAVAQLFLTEDHRRRFLQRVTKATKGLPQKVQFVAARGLSAGAHSVSSVFDFSLP